MPKEERLTAKHHKAIALIKSGQTIRSAAKQAGFNDKYLYDLVEGRGPIGLAFKGELDLQKKAQSEDVSCLVKENQRLVLEMLQAWLVNEKKKKKPPSQEMVKRLTSLAKALGGGAALNVDVGNINYVGLNSEDLLSEFKRLKREAREAWIRRCLSMGRATVPAAMVTVIWLKTMIRVGAPSPSLKVCYWSRVEII